MVDNFKLETGIINLPEQAALYDYIVVASGKFQTPVCEGLIDAGFPPHKILKSSVNHTDFEKLQFPTAWLFRRKIKSFTETLIKYLFRISPRINYIYYAENEPDINLLLCHKAHNSSNNNVFLVVRRVATDLLVSRVINVIKLLFAKVIVIDHESTGWLFNLIRQVKPVVQLWHGLPYKNLQGNRHYSWINDTLFISSSVYFNQTVFEKIFRARRHIALGYCRNDALIESAEYREFAFSLSRDDLEKFKKQFSQFYVYMPTYRDSKSGTVLDFDRLNLFAESKGSAILVKYHPFEAEMISKLLEVKIKNKALTQVRSNIFIFPTKCDIYPWLADACALITDYSSVVYDFLIVDRPIIYFQFDRDAYMRVRGTQLMDDAMFIAGELAIDINELVLAMNDVDLEVDKYKEQRRTLINKIGIERKACTHSIVEKIENLDS